MSKQARTELLSVWRAKYASVTSRYRKARIIDYVMQSAGYKSRKTVIRLLSGKMREKAALIETPACVTIRSPVQQPGNESK